MNESGMSVLLAACLSIQGCSFLAPRTQVLHVKTSVSDAEIYLNGQLIGKGSVSYPANRGEKVEVTVQKTGYYSVTRTIERTLSVLGRLDTIGGYLLLIPLLGLMAPGAYQLEETMLDIRLRREAGTEQEER